MGKWCHRKIRWVDFVQNGLDMKCREGGNWDYLRLRSRRTQMRIRAGQPEEINKMHLAIHGGKSLMLSQ